MTHYHVLPSLLLTLLCLAASTVTAQENSSKPKPDTTMIFGTLTVPAERQSSENVLHNAWGVDVLISTNGFGIGTFYRHEYSENVAGYLDFSISEAKDGQEVEFIDPYTGQRFIPGKVNRFLLLPLMVGVQKRLFKDDILDNFRPYINGAVGPTMIYVFPYNEEYFRALGQGRPAYTAGGYVGVGAYFGEERSNVLSLNLRYYFVPYSGGLESFRRGDQIASKKSFGGFYITLSFGNAW